MSERKDLLQTPHSDSYQPYTYALKAFTSLSPTVTNTKITYTRHNLCQPPTNGGTTNCHQLSGSTIQNKWWQIYSSTLYSLKKKELI